MDSSSINGQEDKQFYKKECINWKTSEDALNTLMEKKRRKMKKEEPILNSYTYLKIVLL